MIIKMILTNSFDPDPRVYKEAKTLVENGNDVEVLCWDRESKYKEKPCEEVDGIKIKRFFSKGQYGSGYKQLFGYLKFKKEAENYINGNNCDAIHCHDFDGLYIGYKIKKHKNMKLVFDEHDFFYLYFKNRRGMINKIFSIVVIFIEQNMLRKVDNHIVVTPKAKEFYKNEKKVTVISNAPFKNSFNNIDKEKKNGITIGFIGTVRYYKELKSLITVANNHENINILIAGKGIALNHLKEFISRSRFTNVEIVGEYKLNQLQDLYSQIDITYLIYPLQDSIISLPNKFFESIITETPIIADRKAEYGQIVKQLCLGWVINSSDLSNSLGYILEEINKSPEIINNYKLNMRKIKDQCYWESNIEKLLEIYK